MRIEERTFKISRQFVDVRREPLSHDVASLRKPLLIMHAPRDESIGIENATEIFLAAKHPKSFISLDGADHLLSDRADAAFAGQAMAGWLSRYVPADSPQEDDIRGNVRVMETGEGRFQNMVRAGRHRLFARTRKNGWPRLRADAVRLPFHALGACTSMTLRLYADRKNIYLGRVSVDVAHEKVHAVDCAECAANASPAAKVDRFTRTIAVDTEVTEELRSKIIEIANKCPVRRTLESSSSCPRRRPRSRNRRSRKARALFRIWLATSPLSKTDGAGVSFDKHGMMKPGSVCLGSWTEAVRRG